MTTVSPSPEVNRQGQHFRFEIQPIQPTYVQLVHLSKNKKKENSQNKAGKKK